MKFIIATLLVCTCFALSLEARTFPENNVDKRFLGSIGSWINNNIIDNINNHVINPVVDGVNTAIGATIDGLTTAGNVIADPFISFGNQFMNIIGQVDNFFSNTLVSAVNDAYDTIKDNTLMVVNIAQAIFNPGSNNQGGEQQDPCATTCFTRIVLNNQQVDYFFDKPNGCISKAINDPNASKYFNKCCDQHNECLNAQCCTDNCQELKNECDLKYNSCVRSACKPYYDDEIEFQTCQIRGAYIVSSARNKTCRAEYNNINKKICFC